MEVDLQSLFDLLCTAVLIGWDPAISPTPSLPPHLDSYTRTLLVSKDRRHLVVTPWLWDLPSRYSQRNKIQGLEPGLQPLVIGLDTRILEGFLLLRICFFKIHRREWIFIRIFACFQVVSIKVIPILINGIIRWMFFSVLRSKSLRLFSVFAPRVYKFFGGVLWEKLCAKSLLASMKC